MIEPRFGICYDFRNPPDSGISMPDLYAQALEQMRWADSAGLDQVWFTEHHFVDDGYLPSWIPVASAAAATTKRLRFSTDICLMPFNHPIRLAEDLAVLDNISGGRVEVGIGMGYAPHEFRGFGIPYSRRVSLMDEGIEVLQRAFTGERFSFKGKRYTCEDVQITPGYVQEGGPPLWIAAMSKAGAERAARFGAHFLPQGRKAESFTPWQEATRADGRDPAAHRVGIIRSVVPARDPEKIWPRIREAERYRMKLYQRFFSEAKQSGLGRHDDPISQSVIVGDVDHCVQKLVAFMREFSMTDIVSMGIPPGMTAGEMEESLELFANDVVPEVRRRLAAG